MDITDQQNRTESVSYYVWADGVNPNWNSSVQFSHSVMFNSLQPRGLQHASLPCPSPIPGACSNSCPLSQGYHPTVSILCHPLLLLPSILPNIRLFSNEYSGLISFWIDWLDLLAVKETLKSFSNTKVQNHQFFCAQPSLWSNSHIHT